MNVIRIIAVSLVLFFVGLRSCELVERDGVLVLKTIYGQTTITEPVLIELIKCPAMERLKQLRQYGVTYYAQDGITYNRYEHSLGVFFIVREHGASVEEQIDALLHDASHTVFSHVGDYVFNHRHKKTSYQDEIHEWFLQEMGVKTILCKYGFDDACSESAKKRHRCLEQDKPNLCADRIEYNFNGGLVDGLLTMDQLRMMYASLCYENNEWFFDDEIAAATFGYVSIKLSQVRWGAAWNVFVDHCAAQALLRAMDLKIIDKKTIHFSHDDAVWQTLNAVNDAEIGYWLKMLCGCKNCYSITNEQDYDLYVVGKFSGTDPLVKTEHGFKRVSELDAHFAQVYKHAKEQIAQGTYIKFVTQSPLASK